MVVVDSALLATEVALDKLDAMCRKLKKRPDVSYGGLDVVLCKDGKSLATIAGHGRAQSFDYLIELRGNHRQHTV